MYDNEEERKVPFDQDVEQEKTSEEPVKGEKDDRGPPPSDRFYLIGFMVTFLGLSILLVQTFVTTANDYWMYKFRDPAFPTYNANNRTSLQASFTSSLSVAMALPTGIALICALTVAQKFKARNRINFSFSVILACFFLLTIFVKINTDSWQGVFFGIVMVIMGCAVSAFVILTASLIVSIPRLPMSYMKLFMYGQGAAGIFSATLQIICLAIAEDSTTVALIYFSCGTAIYGLALGLYVASKYSPFFQYYCNEKGTEVKRALPKWSEMKRAFANMWPILAVMGLVVLSQTTTHPNITNLVVSENYGNGSPWTEKYFVPTITFFGADIAGVIGRVFASNYMTRKNKQWFILAMLVVLATYPFLFIFCNVKTSNHIREAIFKHDWQYILILLTFVPITGFFQTTSVLSLPHFKDDRDKSLDLYYLLMQMSMMLLGIATAPIGVVLVNLL